MALSVLFAAATDPVAPGTILAISLAAVVVAAAWYIWVAVATSRIFGKLGEPAWKAWVPVVNPMTVLRVGGYSAIWVIPLLLPFVPFVGLAGAVVFFVAVHSINRQFDRGAGFTVLAVLLFPVWASVLGFGSARPKGELPADAAALLASTPFESRMAGLASAGAVAPSRAPAFDPSLTSTPESAPTVAPAPTSTPTSAPTPTPTPAPMSTEEQGPIAASFEASSFSFPEVAPFSSAPGQSFPEVTPFTVPVDLPEPDPAPEPERWPLPPAPAVKPEAPEAPVEPVGPDMPVGPVAPDAPVGPVEPGAPVGPVEPVGPVAPAGPGAPDVPPIPATPATPAAPSVPSEPSVPSAPAAPAAPSVPVWPSAPTEPSATDVPEVPVGPMETTAPAPAAGNGFRTAPRFDPDPDPVPDDDLEPDIDPTIVKRRGPKWALLTRTGKIVPMTADLVLIGRNPSASGTDIGAQLVAIADPTKMMSKTHARLELVYGQWMITDLDSTNGTILVGAAGEELDLEPRVPTSVRGAVKLGQLEITLQQED